TVAMLGTLRFAQPTALAHTRAAVIDEAGLFDPAVGVLLATLLAAPRMPRVAVDGAAVAARRVLELLAERS
ncbi:MAG: hypothetical protein Q8O33_09270, partial [Pseudomonadota bacterium]|nr:hypothetical protein [Pseudomonadota bacterium]